MGDSCEWLQCFDSNPKKLSEEELRQLEDDKVVLSEYKLGKLEKDAQRNWDLFYKRNTTAFYKDRHWTAREFPELATVSLPRMSMFSHYPKKATTLNNMCRSVHVRML